MRGRGPSPFPIHLLSLLVRRVPRAIRDLVVSRVTKDPVAFAVLPDPSDRSAPSDQWDLEVLMALMERVVSARSALLAQPDPRVTEESPEPRESLARRAIKATLVPLAPLAPLVPLVLLALPFPACTGVRKAST